jgi:sugar phosphate isomerase/epimerase
MSLEAALRKIAELHFGKYDIAIHERGHHLKPSEVAADVQAASARLKHGPGLTPAAIHVATEAGSGDEQARQLRAVFRLARINAVPLVTVTPGSAEAPFEAEAARLARIVRMAEADGIVVCAETVIGTHTQTPSGAVRLCEAVKGLYLALDPSHFIAGPHQGQCHDEVYPFVRHVRLRDTGRGANQFQVRVGQGEIEYGRIITQLERYHYNLALSVDVRDIPDSPFPMEPEVRKLKYLLESLV